MLNETLYILGFHVYVQVSACDQRAMQSRRYGPLFFSFSTADPISQALALLARVQPCSFPCTDWETPKYRYQFARAMARDFIGTTFQLASTDPVANGKHI